MDKVNKREPVKILIVDDIEMNVTILENIIRSEGYEPLCALNVKEALELMNEDMPQLILSDLSMPGMNGLEFCKLLKKNPKTRDIPFIFITVADDSEDKRMAFEMGAVDYILKPIRKEEVVVRVNNHLNSYRAKQEIQAHNRMMHHVIAEQKKIVEKEQENLLIALSKILVKKNHEMGSHLERVGYNSKVLAQGLQLTDEYVHEINDEFVDIIFTAAQLHDIGVLVVPDEMFESERINRTTDDTEYVRLHTTEGAAFLEEIGSHGNMSNFIHMATDIARYHHTHFNGTGYPKDVAGMDIPLAARITTIVNDFDLRIQKNEGMENAIEEAVTFICEGSGTRYDPDMIRIFSKIINQLNVTI